MGFAEVKLTWDRTYPKGTSQRFKDLDALDRMLDGTIYDKLQYPFHQEYDSEDVANPHAQYIHLYKRRPSVKYGAAKIIVDNCANLTFGDGKSPHVQVFNPFMDDEDVETKKNIEMVVKSIQVIREVVGLDAVMREAVRKGATGSAVLIIHTNKAGKPWVEVVTGKYAWPVFAEDDPAHLEQLVQVWPTTGGDLIDKGYSVEELKRGDEPFDPEATYWMCIGLDAQVEQWMIPLTVKEYERLGEAKDNGSGETYEWEPDGDRTYPHSWGVVPAVWVRNMEERLAADGPCTFGQVTDLMVEIDYLLSQSGRGYKYAMDPQLAFEGDGLKTTLPASGGLPAQPNSPDKPVIRTPARSISAPSGSKVKLLEITGAGLKEARDHIKTLREYLLEIVSGNKSDQEHSGGPQSGRAMEILYQALVWLIGIMRTDYGAGGLVPLLRLLLLGFQLGICKHELLEPAMIPKFKYLLLLVWPEWWLPRGTDLWNTIQALELAAGGSQKDPIQIMPMAMIFRQVAVALGHPDPTRVSDEMMEEYDLWKAEKERIRQEELSADRLTTATT